MHEFETFVYLGMQKTGSTFISDVLSRFSKEREIQHLAHQPMGPEHDPGKFYFISMRDPLDAYLSLFSYGSEQKGRTRNNFARDGIVHFFDGTAAGFSKWLAFALRPKNSGPLDKPYLLMGEGKTCELIGFQTWRYLRLAIAQPPSTLGACRSKDDIRALYEKAKLPRYIIRHENFTADFVALVRGPLAYAIGDVDAAVKYIETAKPRNVSDRIERYEGKIVLKPRLAAKLREREWFLHEIFGY